MMNPQVQNNVQAQGGGYGPPPGGYGAPPGGAPPAGMPGGAPPGMPGGMPPGGMPMQPHPGAPMMGPPGGMMPPGGSSDMEKTLGKWFILSCVSIVCGCGLLGLVPIYMTHTAKQALANGDMATVEKNLKIAKICVILGWVFFILYFLSMIVWTVVGGGLAMFGM